MAKEVTKILIRSALIPVFYQKFRCLAHDCRDNCCGGWNIALDKKSYLHLRHLNAPPALRERLEHGVRREKKANDDKFYGKFDLEYGNGYCPFLDEDRLCAIQRACGPEALPSICVKFPRKEYYTPAAKEYSLSPACEGVLQLLWDMPEGVEFVEDPLPKEAWRSITIPQDENLLLYFTPVRGAFIDILQNRAMPLTERMLCLGMMIQRLLKEDWTNFDLDGWEKQTALLIESGAVSKTDIPGNRDMYLMQNLNALSVVATPEKSWSADIYHALEATWSLLPNGGEDASASEKAERNLNCSKTAYDEALAQFKAAFSDYEYFFENLMVASALAICFPELRSKENLWERYVTLCNLYSFYRFVSVVGCKEETTKERLFHIITMAGRDTLHKPPHFDWLQEQLSKNDSSTLAHMAILLRWD